MATASRIARPMMIWPYSLLTLSVKGPEVDAPHDVDAVLDQLDDQRAEHGAQRGAAATEQARAAHHRGRDHCQLVALARGGVGRLVEARREQAGQPGAQPGQRVDAQLDGPHAQAGVARRGLVAPHRVDLAPGHGVREEQPEDQRAAEHDQHRHGLHEARRGALAERPAPAHAALGEARGQLAAERRQRLGLDRHQAEAAEDRHRPERDDEGVQAQADDERAVEQAAGQADAERDRGGDAGGEQARGVGRQVLQHGGRAQRREAEDRAHRDVDAARDDHGRGAQRHDRHPGHGRGHVGEQVVPAQEGVHRLSAHDDRVGRERDQRDQQQHDEQQAGLLQSPGPGSPIERHAYSGRR
jgi:hypothetical protein